MGTRLKRKPPEFVVTLAWVAAMIVVWELCAFLVAATKRTPENILPHLWQIVASVFSTAAVSSGRTAAQIVLTSAGDTLLRALYGFLIGMAVGYALALLMKLSGVIEKIAFPYLLLIQMVPILGMAPIILAITKDINKSRIIIAAILTFYPVSTNVMAGFKAVEPEKLDLMYMCAASKAQVYWKTLIPAAMPYFFTGLRISAPMAITASILVDTLQGSGGLGCMLSQSQKHAMSIFVFWQIVFLSALIGVFSAWLMGFIERRVSPQKRFEKREGA